MKIEEKIFSAELKNKFRSREDTEIRNLDPDLSGLITAGVCREWKGDLIWIFPEESNLFEARALLNLWMDLTGRRREVVVLQLPFGDPYVDNLVYPDFHIEKFNLFRAKMDRKPVVVIASFLSASLRVEEPEYIERMILKVAVGDGMPRDRFIGKLYEMGYAHTNYVDGPGEFQKRGGIVDLFPSGMDNPLRIEFFGDRVESITPFDSRSRRSIGYSDRIVIPVYGLFGKEMGVKDMISSPDLKPLTSILDNVKVIFNGKSRAQRSAGDTLENFRRIFALNTGTEVPEPGSLFMESISGYPVIDVSGITDEITSDSEIRKMRKNLRQYSTADLEDLRERSKESTVCLFTKSAVLGENLRAGGVRLYSSDFIIPFSFMNRVSNTFFLTDRQFIYIDPGESSEDFESDSLLKTLVPGDHVVHEKHGIGIFRGLQLLKFGDSRQEFIMTEYQNKEILYVPVSEANVLKKYFSFKGDPAKLDRIGGKTWNTKRNRAKKSIVNFARDLLDLYAVRRSIKGYSHPGDSDMEHHLQNSFPHVETPDQVTAIKDVLSDLEKDFPMERLVCGDVSFGKTEVAVRAAVRVVGSGKQVAVLCPTTILALQHFRTFSERLRGLPVIIRMLSRMVPPEERKRILSDLESGNVDILIGTHSILSEKAAYRDLGLFIIDEEQRFGVFQKEKLKRGKENVDVLVLSATPIPRTLSLSMAGLQDISTIRTPPRGRIRIRNYIGSFSREIIVSAVLKEVKRDGGIYIVYNSVEKIFSFRDLLKKWLPELKISVIHAQMNSSRIEKNLVEFINGEYSVLLSTTIIENGIDIPGVNTLIVIDAENFGLTQLYQLRGRIGRGDQQAYAYFLTGSESVSAKARLRLDGIRDHSEIGAGFHLAEYDLKLRGAGSLLGNRQHGHIEALGFDYYNAMLKESVDELKGAKPEQWRGEIRVNFRYSFEADYIPSASDRIDFYSRIIETEDPEAIARISEDLSNRFGDGGAAVSKIFYVARVRLIAKKTGAEKVSVSHDHFSLEFGEEGTAAKLFGTLNEAGILPVRKDGKTLYFGFSGENELLDNIYHRIKGDEFL